MPLASTWTLLAIDTQDADLRLNRITPWGEAGPLVPVEIHSEHPPIDGQLVDLLAGDGECVFAAQDVRSPRFAITMTFAEPVNVRGFRFAGPDARAWPVAHSVMANNQVSSFKAAQWLGVNVLSPEPTRDIPLGKETESWVVARGAATYREIAASADGQVHFFAALNTFLMLSVDGGDTWGSMVAPGTGSWTGAGVSGDGNTLVGAANGGNIWVSRDRGATWSATNAGSRAWSSIAVNGDGSVILAAAGTGGLYLSTDGGVTWQTVPLGNRSWNRCAVSADGQKLMATANGWTPMLSRDGGATWGAVQSSGAFFACAIAEDGQTMLVGGSNGLRVTKDNGASWVQPPQITVGNVQACGVSADGEIMACAVSTGTTTGTAWLSTDGGANWSFQGATGNRSWSQGFVTKNGELAAVTSNNGNLFYYRFPDPIYVPGAPYSRREMQGGVAGAELCPQGLHAVRRARQQMACDVENGGNGCIYGPVELYSQGGNIPLKRRVRLHRSRDGMLVRETWSDAQGNYRFEGLSERYTYDVIAWDHEGLQQSVVANDLQPELMP